MTFEAVMVQLQCMDACLDTLSDELCQVNTHVDCTAWRQARLGGFVESPSPSPEVSEDDGDDDDDDDDDDKDEDALPVTTRWLLELLALCHLWQKGEVVLGMRVVKFLEGELV